MTRAVLIARAFAAVILIAFVLLMANLYIKLKKLEATGRPPVTSP